MTGAGRADRALARLLEVQDELERAYQAWRLESELDLDGVLALHDSGAIAAHTLYTATIPAYRQLAEELDLLHCDDAAEIRGELASTDHTFKSYDPQLLEAGDYAGMTTWLEGISSLELGEAARVEARTTSEWLELLAQRGWTVRFSSGTSGHLSFVPREERTERRLREHTIAQWRDMPAPDEQLDLSRYEAFFLAYDGGAQAFSSQGRLLASLTAAATFLYPIPSDPDAIRLAVAGGDPAAGAATSELREPVAAHRRETVERRRENYERILNGLERTAREGVPTFLYGTPFQLLDLCKIMEERGAAMAGRRESVLLIGGGWKSFEGERVSREELLARASERLGFEPGRSFEGYGQTECNVHFNRCREGRLHVPPLILPMVLDDALYPREGDGSGRYAFADPFSTSFPGFFISGDQLELTRDPCGCGRPGFSVVGEVTRVPSEEIKGCGGVMAAARG